MEKRVANVIIEGEGKQHEVSVAAPLKLCSNFNCQAIVYNLEQEVSVIPPE